jgi:regulation of enolase protein 1 (concanavalin A-like superfamily)
VAGHVSFQSGGLLLWNDRQNFLRLERAGMNRNGLVQTSGYLELCQNGRVAASQVHTVPEQDTYLRMERRGNQVLTAVSQDGRTWVPLQSVVINYPSKVRVGVFAINAAQQPLAVRYEEFRLEKK